ncbi:protein translocase subunit secE/sec61 gamma [Alkalithermobacter thermoalcaliphilus JW-YL-7 = DSM 7308]|uniref:Protein translocase subunit SecE n=1 Tax=Alkalithermobacter thermoalcaliphilus JW-YL-7 = DSM 7308 TaxID=1121328 RepID=A0A150FN09_CLOPD|nr:preprotein translocase, SecE subunit [[Clostridium] paradoxum JW-YL-7 = DSM 7308]SHL35391.1 protein translocase subunit secE/sec61 gamma [[Clostridium] paradoxum JW-YL-7 = DSM 7308]
MSVQVNTNKENAKSISNFLKGTKAELKKVHWPNKKELINYTTVVLASCLMMALLIWAIDSGIGYLLKLILR